jgi:hypothetical protein
MEARTRLGGRGLGPSNVNAAPNAAARKIVGNLADILGLRLTTFASRTIHTRWFRQARAEGVPLPVEPPARQP